MAATPHDVSNLTIALVGLGGIVVGAGVQAFTGFLTDRRKARHDHDAWLREQRLRAFIELLQAADACRIAVTEPLQRAARTTILDAALRLRAVIPKSLEHDLDNFVYAHRDELRKDPADPSIGPALGRQYATFSMLVSDRLGFNAEPITGSHAPVLRRMQRRIHRFRHSGHQKSLGTTTPP